METSVSKHALVILHSVLITYMAWIETEWENKLGHTCPAAWMIQVRFFSRNVLAGRSSGSKALNSNTKCFSEMEGPQGEKGRDKIFRETSNCSFLYRDCGLEMSSNKIWLIGNKSYPFNHFVTLCFSSSPSRALPFSLSPLSCPILLLILFRAMLHSEGCLLIFLQSLMHQHLKYFLSHC